MSGQIDGDTVEGCGCLALIAFLAFLFTFGPALVGLIGRLAR